MAVKAKTWAQLTKEIDETFRKWRAATSYRIENTLPPRSRTKRTQTLEERQVRLHFVWWKGATRREIALVMRREPTALENLEAVATTIEMLRMAEYRKVEGLLSGIYRQMFPQQQQAVPPPPPPPSSHAIPEHYRLLHVDPAAPLAVCEAAYKALARTAHPDAGGSEEVMKRLNAAIEKVRAEKQ